MRKVKKILKCDFCGSTNIKSASCLNCAAERKRTGDYTSLNPFRREASETNTAK